MMIESSPPVAAALAAHGPVVALESTLICHGIPRPANGELARRMEASVAAAGAVPATIAVQRGILCAGLSPRALAELAAADSVAKCSTRDLPLVLARGGDGATTVAATIFVAARLGIQVMATGGLGGVHLGGAASLDMSADLDELARSPVAVICCGVKSILDQARTLERLETLSVPVVGFGCAELPGFYTAASGLAIPRLDTLAELAALIEAQRGLGMPGGVVIAVPPPAEHAMARKEVDGLVADAQAASAAAGITGAAQTPFMLRHMAERSGGRTVQVNCALAEANAALAGRLAACLAERRRC